MRSGLAAALLLLSIASEPAGAQAPVALRPAVPAAEAGRGTAMPPQVDAALVARRNETEARLKRRETDAKRTLRSICRGC